MTQTATIQLTRESYYNGGNTRLFNEGEIIKLKGKKRIVFKITDTSVEPYQHTISLLPYYKPSPKSTLKAKTVFSKIKMRLL